jgi:hypothetical protein
MVHGAGSTTGEVEEVWAWWRSGQTVTLRAGAPDRPEHVVNNMLVGPDDAGRLVASVEALRQIRPRAIWVDARGSRDETLSLLRAALDLRGGPPAGCGHPQMPR